MNLSKNLSDIYFFIAGAAKSGFFVAKLLKKNGAKIFVTEQNKLSNEFQIELNNLNIQYEQDGHSLSKIISECDIMILSPGISLNSDICLLCKNNNIPIVSEIEVASWFMKIDDICLAVTGTNGKSTTVNYLSQLLTFSKYNSIACGNIGISFSQSLMEHPEKNLFSIEMSSYQLETTYSLRPLCTAILNIQEDHLDRYITLEEYLKAKWRLILLTDDSGLTIIHKNILTFALKIGLSLPRCKIIIIDDMQDNINTNKLLNKNKKLLLNDLIFGKTLPISIYQELNSVNINNLIYPHWLNYAYTNYNYTDNSIQIVIKYQDKTKELKIKTPCIPGKHNMYNILCASLMAMHIGLSEKTILSQWEAETTQYVHLPHRLEKISSGWNTYIDNSFYEKKLLIVNDSKATNVESTLVALESFNKPIRLLLGGKPKGDSFIPIKKYFNKNLIKVYPFGKAAEIIYHELFITEKDVAIPSPTLLSAANLAIDDSKENDIILLSPGCSSFDEFKNFEHRGDIFRKWALSHLKENKNEYQ